MSQPSNYQSIHFNNNSLIALILILLVLATLVKAGAQSPNSGDSVHDHYWPDVRTAVNTLVSIFLFVLSTAKTIVSKTTFIAFAPARFSWRATKWVTLTVWHSVVAFASIPVVTYILVVIGCGAVIGGCAGFAVELVTVLVYSATWGKKAAVPADDADARDEAHDLEYAGHEGDHGENQMASNAMLELLQHHLADYAKDQSIRQRRSVSTSTAPVAASA